MKKTAFVVQRYGLEVNGGAELLARQMAEHMPDDHEVHVITTMAVDYMTWKNEYKNRDDVVNGIKVHRFPVDKPRNVRKFNKLSEKVLNTGSGRDAEEKWVDMQGPHSSELIQYIKDHKDDYDIFVFFTYLYYTTVRGIKEVAEKSVLIPTAHDEAPIHLSVYDDVFKSAAGFFYCTVPEMEFVEERFHIGNVPHNNGLGGAGVDLPSDISEERFRNKYGIENDYIIYVGRIDENKGCRELFKDYTEFKKTYPSDLKLLLMGKEMIDVPKDPDIISLGFVSEEDKFDAIKGSEFLIMPSPFESLSIVVLEAMSLKRPVLVNGNCDVLKYHCIKSNGGLYYTNQNEFFECTRFLLNNKEKGLKMGENGYNYVMDNYSWGSIMNRFTDLLETVSKQ